MLTDRIPGDKQKTTTKPDRKDELFSDKIALKVKFLSLLDLPEESHRYLAPSLHSTPFFFLQNSNYYKIKY